MTLQEIVVAEGFTGQFNDAWHEFFDSQIITKGSWNDRMSEFLETVLGYTGSLSDKIATFVANYP